MNDKVLKELASKWLRDAKPPEVSDGSEEAKLGNALAKGVRIGLEECAGDLLSIIKLLGDE
jgi:hypothetical protein